MRRRPATENDGKIMANNNNNPGLRNNNLLNMDKTEDHNRDVGYIGNDAENVNVERLRVVVRVVEWDCR